MTGSVLQSKFRRASLGEVGLHSSWHILLPKAGEEAEAGYALAQAVAPQGGPMSSCMVRPLCHTSECAPLGAWSSSKDSF